MKFQEGEDCIFIENEQGERIAEITFQRIGDDACINHTYVADCLRGQGIANQLMEHMIAKLKREHRKVSATCSYAQKWMEKHPEEKDMYIDK